MFRVRLSIGSIEVTGEGSTAQAAKHAAATNALQRLKRDETTPAFSASSKPIKSNLNPASVPFVPSSAKSTSPIPTPTLTAPSLSSAAAPTSNASAAANSKTNCKSQSEVEQKSSASSAQLDPNYSELKSPISLVHENALKRNMTVKFEVARETGPPHMRTFLTR